MASSACVVASWLPVRALAEAVLFGLNQPHFAAKLNSFGWVLLASATAAVALAYGWWSWRQQDRLLLAETSALARVATHGVAFSREGENEGRLRQVVDSLLSSNRFSYVSLHDDRGLLLVERGSLPTLGVPGFAAEALSLRTAEQGSFVNSIDGHRYLQVNVPVFAAAAGEAAAPRGFVRVGLAAKPAFGAATWPLVWIALLVVAAGFLPVWWWGKRLMRPLDAIGGALAELVAGQVEALPAGSAGDPFAALIADFNGMAARLRESRREVVNFQLQLEEKVRARTLELAQSCERAQRRNNQLAARAEYLGALLAERQALFERHEAGLAQLAVALGPSQQDRMAALQLELTTLREGSRMLLELTRSQRLGSDLDCLDFDPRELVAELCEVFAEPAQRHQVELIVDIAQSVPRLLRGDPGRLRLLGQCLLSQALARCSSADLVVRLLVGQRDALSVQLRFEVARSDRAAVAVGPQTLPGRALLDQWAAQMGGGFEAPDGVVRGFHCRFELREPALESANQRVEQLRGLRVLVVDDKEASREMLDAQLTAWGMRPEFAADGQAALALVKRERGGFDLALANMIMVGMDGIELARKLAERDGLARTRVILMAAAHHHINTRKARYLGIRAVVSRPLHANRLMEALCRVMDEPQRLDELERLPEGLPDAPQFDARVLVAEDNGVNQAVAESMLESLGCRIVLANNGREAVAQVAQTPCDLILMDIQMPEMDGIEAMKRIREQERALKPPRHTPMVAVTAHAIPGDRENYLSLGMDDYLSKPFDLEQLTALLSRWLSPRGSRARRVREVVTAPSTGALDPSILARLRAMETPQSPAIVEKLIQMFQEDSPRIVHELHEAVAKLQPDTARRALHTLKSSSANLGARTLSELCTRMELLAREGDLDKLAETLVDLQCEYERVLIALAAEKRAC